MSGVVVGTMCNEPYATRLYCEAAPAGATPLKTVSAKDIPENVQKALCEAVEITPLNVVRFRT